MTLRQHRELLVSAGWLAALLACVCYDSGDLAGAETARRMTYQLGEHAEHGELVGWAFEIAAWFALVEGRFPDTIALCDAGLAHAGVSNAGVQLTLQASRGYARMGDSRAAQMLGRPVHAQPGYPNPSILSITPRSTARRTSYIPRRSTRGWVPTMRQQSRIHEVVARCHDAEGNVRWPTRLSTTLVSLGQIAGRRGDRTKP